MFKPVTLLYEMNHSRIISGEGCRRNAVTCHRSSGEMHPYGASSCGDKSVPLYHPVYTIRLFHNSYVFFKALDLRF